VVSLHRILPSFTKEIMSKRIQTRMVKRLKKQRQVVKRVKKMQARINKKVKVKNLVVMIKMILKQRK